MITYLFWFEDNEGLNHILIELKKELFNNWNVNIGVDNFCELFLGKNKSGKSCKRKAYHVVKKII